MLSIKSNAIVEKVIYIGQAKRNLSTRLDHNLSSTNQETNVTKHISDNPSHNIDFNDITVLSTANYLQ